MKKIMICMAFFGILIGNGHAGITPVVCNENAKALLNALDTSDVGNILDQLAKLNKDIKHGAVEVSEVNTGDVVYNDLIEKLVAASINCNKNTGYKYYLKDTNLSQFNRYILANLQRELRNITEYENILKFNLTTSVCATSVCAKWKGLVIEGETCAHGQKGKVDKKIHELYEEMARKITSKRIMLLKKLLKEKMKEKIIRLNRNENTAKRYETAKQYAKDEVSKIINEIVSEIIDDDDYRKVITKVLKGEITDKLLNSIMEKASKGT